VWPSGVGLGHDLVADHAAGARPVLDDDRLAQRLLQLRRDQTAPWYRRRRPANRAPPAGSALLGKLLRPGASGGDAGRDARGGTEQNGSPVSFALSRNRFTCPVESSCRNQPLRQYRRKPGRREKLGQYLPINAATPNAWSSLIRAS